MPKKKRTPAYKKYAAPRFPKKVREAAEDLRLAARARKVTGEAALGTRKTSKAHKDYKRADGAYRAAGRTLAKLTGYEWKRKK